MRDQLWKPLIQFISSAWQILRIVIRRIGEERVPEGAASVAFFGFFSLFPLLLVLTAIGTMFIESPVPQERVLALILQMFPFSGEIIEENLRYVLRVRGTVSILALVGLTWSATGAFNALTRNINRAWPNTKPRNFIRTRLISYGMLTGLVGILAAILLANTLIRLLPQPVSAAASLATKVEIPQKFLFWFFLLIALTFLYRWLPNTPVRWKEAFWGALLASLGVQIVTLGFIWYLSSGLSNYNLIYGSLGAVVALLTWIYLVVVIIFFGAHWGAAIAQQDRHLLVN